MSHIINDLYYEDKLQRREEWLQKHSTTKQEYSSADIMLDQNYYEYILIDDSELGKVVVYLPTDLQRYGGVQQSN